MMCEVCVHACACDVCVMWYYIPGLYRTKALVLELLAAVCLVRGGHDIILAAFDNLKEVKGFTKLSHTIADFT